MHTRKSRAQRAEPRHGPEAATATAPTRVDIDLRSLRSWTQDGAAALVRCREICGELPDGLHYRTGRGPGRAALLAAYT